MVQPAAPLPTHEDVRGTLARVFGYHSFRPLQEEIINSLLQGRDVLALMPTGGGKSLTYQLPSLLLEGTAVVISPLIALMKDQVDALRTLGVEATFVNSSLTGEEAGRRNRQVSEGGIKLLYVAPERAVMPAFMRLLHSTRVSLIAIDEAHCISEWGHDFRPEYRELRALRRSFPSIPLAAFTATATARVQEDIISQLELREPAHFRGTFNRPNLYYEVRPKQDALAVLMRYLKARPGDSGIIYCLSRAGTEELATVLQGEGIKAVSYHAGLDRRQREQRQEDFVKDRAQVIVATIAFGMGIDKPDVRYVIHYDLPRTLENYYQESGRAGRDGEASDCILFYSPADISRARWFADQKEDPHERAIAHEQLKHMTAWAETTECRRTTLLAHFDERIEPPSGRCCDNCAAPTPLQDVTVPAQMFLSCVKRTGERFGRSYVIDVLRGSRSARVREQGHESLPTYGIGRNRSKEDWQELAAMLLREDYLVPRDEFGGLKVTERGSQVLFKGLKVVAPVRQRPRAQIREPERRDRSDLFEQLRLLRKRLAEEAGVPAYVIFQDPALWEMVQRRPKTLSELSRIPGVGEKRLHDYGSAFLSVLAAAAESSDQPDPARAGGRTAEQRSLNTSAMVSLQLFRSGLGAEDIARERGLAVTTIENHLATALLNGEELDINRLVPEERRPAIEAVLRRMPGGGLSPVKEQLGDGYSYGEIRLTQAWMERQLPE